MNVDEKKKKKERKKEREREKKETELLQRNEFYSLFNIVCDLITVRTWNVEGRVTSMFLCGMCSRDVSRFKLKFKLSHFSYVSTSLQLLH